MGKKLVSDLFKERLFTIGHYLFQLVRVYNVKYRPHNAAFSANVERRKKSRKEALLHSKSDCVPTNANYSILCTIFQALITGVYAVTV